MLAIYLQAKQEATEEIAKKVALDKEQAAKRETAIDYEKSMRQKAASVGNIVYNDVPVSANEVRISLSRSSAMFSTEGWPGRQRSHPNIRPRAIR